MVLPRPPRQPAYLLQGWSRAAGRQPRRGCCKKHPSSLGGVMASHPGQRQHPVLPQARRSPRGPGWVGAVWVREGRCVPYPPAAPPARCLDREPVSALGTGWSRFPCRGRKKRVLTDSPFAATGTQFVGAGTGAGGSGAEGRNRRQTGAGVLGLHPAQLPPARQPWGSAVQRQLPPSWALGHLPVPGSPRGDASALQHG